MMFMMYFGLVVEGIYYKISTGKFIVHPNKTSFCPSFKFPYSFKTGSRKTAAHCVTVHKHLNVFSVVRNNQYLQFS